MNVVKEINDYKQFLIQKALTVKNKIDVFYEENEDNSDKIKLLNDFYEKFDKEVNTFSDTYSLTVPLSLTNSIYYVYPQFDSLDITIELKSHYKGLFKKIHDTLPILDDSLEIQD